MGWVRLHPTTSRRRSQIVVEHFREHVAPLLERQGQGDGGRRQPRRRRCAGKLAIDKYIKDRGYAIGTLVAFSGEVNDTESGPDPFTETQHRR